MLRLEVQLRFVVVFTALCCLSVVQRGTCAQARTSTSPSTTWPLTSGGRYSARELSTLCNRVLAESSLLDSDARQALNELCLRLRHVQCSPRHQQRQRSFPKPQQQTQLQQQATIQSLANEIDTHPSHHQTVDQVMEPVLARDRRALGNTACLQIGCSVLSETLECRSEILMVADVQTVPRCTQALSTKVVTVTLIIDEAMVNLIPTWSGAAQQLLSHFTHLKIVATAEPAVQDPFVNMTKGPLPGIMQITVELEASLNLTSLDEEHFSGLTALSVSSTLPDKANVELEFEQFALNPIASIVLDNVAVAKMGPFHNYAALKSLHCINAASNTWYGDRIWGGAPIEELVIVGDTVTHIDDDFVGTLVNLKRLTMNALTFTTLPQRLLANNTKLEYLDLSDNNLEKVEPGLLDSARNLTVVSFKDNWLGEIPPAFFAHQTLLETLDLSENEIRELEVELVTSCLNLQVLDVSDNFLSTLNLDLSNQLKLKRLNARLNEITEVADSLLHKNGQLASLSISFNQLTSLPPSLLQTASANLTSLSIRQNNIKRLDAALFGNNPVPSLQAFFAGFNQLTFIDDAIFALMPSLQQFDVRSNSIKTFPASLWGSCPNLTRVVFAKNHVTSIPRPEQPMKSIAILFFSNNMLKNTLGDKDLFSADWTELFPSLSHVLVNDNVNLEFRAKLPVKLNAMTVANIKHAEIPEDAEWDYAGIGWPGMDTRLDPCRLLSSNAIQLDIIGSELTSFTLNCTVGIVFIRFNHMLEKVTFVQKTRDVDLSDNTKLEDLLFKWRGTSYLDISRTNVPPSSAFCRYHGIDIFIADGMYHEKWGNSAESTLSMCYLQSPVLFSLANTLTDSSLSRFRRSLSEPTALSHSSKFSRAVDTWTFKTVPVVSEYAAMDVQVAGIRCDLSISNQRYLPEGSELVDLWYQIPTVVQECNCASGFHEVTRNGDVYCVKDSVAGKIIGFTTLGLLGGMVLLWGFQRLAHYRTRARKTGLLLEYATNEVEELRRAWEIDFGDVAMLRRVDGDSPGAFGEVWLARWRGAEVAIKLLQSHILSLESEVAAFGQEVEFLRKTRHTNLVQFFGAGTHNASPFLVIEYCALGSLGGFLYNRNGPKDVSVQQRLLFATDAAAGLQYLHSLGAIHRDIKSGNVLISSELRAKITDFGSIRTFFNSPLQDKFATTTLTSTNRTGQSEASMDVTCGVGTPMYMSPEMLKMEPYGPSCDVWAYGILLWEIWTHMRPDIFEQEGIEIRNSFVIRGKLLDLYDAGVRLNLPSAEASVESTSVEGGAHQQPLACPLWYSELYHGCVSADIELRPTFSAITALLAAHSSNSSSSNS
eukprot:m.336376 g.336376  ORF g.336376 m.336376 type:complete len:1333 (-) comp16078_c2_seq18:4005-8003(-)